MKLMSKKTPFNLAVALAMVAVPLLGVTSCDSGPVDTGGDSSFDLGTRYDVDDLLDNANSRAEMPSFLLSGDTFTHQAPTVLLFESDDLNDLADITVNLNEYLVGFQSGDSPMVASSSGQLSNTEGVGVSQNVSYIYDAGTDSFSLAEQNGFASNLSDDALREAFEARMLAILSAGNSYTDSLGGVLNNNYSEDEAAKIIRTAIESTGLMASDSGNFDSFTYLSELTDTTVRLSRTVTYYPTSTNATLLSDKTISGVFEITDEYTDVILADFGSTTDKITLAADVYTYITGTSNLSALTGVSRTKVTYAGDFTLVLETDAF